MSIVLPNDNYVLYSLNLAMTWDTPIGSCDLNNKTISLTTPLNNGECDNNGGTSEGGSCTVDPNKEGWFTYNNKTKTFNFVWNCGKGHSFFYTKDLLTLRFNVDNKAKVTSSIFTLLDNSKIIYGMKGDSLDKLIYKTPLICFYE